MHWAAGWGMGVFGWLFMVIFWALVIWGIVLLVKALTGSTKSEGETETALEVLQKRYASGEINREEFEEKKKDIASI